MAEQWLTYAELGERLGISAEAARQKAIRGRWQRRTTNDGRRQILVDIEDVIASTPPKKAKEDEATNARPTPEEHPSDARTIAALDAHIVSNRGKRPGVQARAARCWTRSGRLGMQAAPATWSRAPR